MADSSNNGPVGQTTAIVAVLVVFVGTILVHQLPFVGSRPAVTEKLTSRATDRQDVDARLWQDPFTPAEQHQQELWRGPSNGARPATAPAWQHLEPGLAAALRDENVKRVDLLLVPVFGRSYVEEAEARRRLRYAILAGLNVSQFTPDAADRIGYFEFSGELVGARNTPRRRETDARLPQLLPFEWFSNRDEPGHRLLVIWVDETSLRTAPLANLSMLTRLALQECAVCSVGRNSCKQFRVAVLGPTSSDTLSQMVVEARRLSSEPQTYSALRAARIYSYSATTASSDLLAKLSPSHRTVGGLAPLLRDNPLKIELVGTILLDRAIVGGLQDEFRKRGVDWADLTTHIVLVSEWDSLYGQEIRQAVSSRLCSNVAASDARRCEARIHRFSYLRGLDGLLPTTASTAKTDDKERRDQRSSRDVALIERPEGGSQFDYLRRLAERIEREAASVQEGERLGAIGVIGTDVYDKLLVLQALRRRFPNTLFFTTDLDARLFQATEFAWSRNLIVGASFGLQLRPDLQRDIPPFRDTYQTSAFFATLLALHNWRPGAPAVPQKTIDTWLAPRLFEIGRERAFDLTPWPLSPTIEPDVDSNCGSNLAQCVGILPARDSVFVDHAPAHLSQIVMIVVAAALLLYAASFRVRSGTARVVKSVIASPVKGLIGLGICAVACGLLVLTLQRVVYEGDQGEPFTWVSGISMWPTEMLRVVAAVLAGAFLVMIHADLGHAMRELTNKFFPGSGTADKDSGAGTAKSWTGRLLRIYSGRVVTERDAEIVDAEPIWKEIVFQHHGISRIVRLVPVCALFFASGSLTVNLLGQPHIPYRGNTSWYVDRILLLGVCTPLMIGVIFSVIDAMKHCDRFTRELTRGVRTKWPYETTSKFSMQLRVPDEAVCHWIDMEFITEWTRRIGPMLYYPFILLAIMLIARSSLFENWDTPLGLVIVFAVVFIYAAACAVMLWLAAARARRAVVHRLSLVLIRAKGQADRSLAEQVEQMIADVKARQGGAFAPIAQQPLVQAILVPISGAGGLSLLEYFLLRW